jgi:hypothetical protein
MINPGTQGIFRRTCWECERSRLGDLARVTPSPDVRRVVNGQDEQMLGLLTDQHIDADVCLWGRLGGGVRGRTW